MSTASSPPVPKGPLTGRVALVTGGTRGIGGAISHRLGEGIGLTVNGVTPGCIVTDMTAAIPAKVLGRLRAQIPAGRFGHPEEVARLVAFLAHDDSSYITGQIWSVNGGLDM